MRLLHGKLHHALTGTGAIAVAFVASIPGTLISHLITDHKAGLLHIGHSVGLIESTASVKKVDDKWVAKSASLIRTARTLMRGEVMIPNYSL